MVSEPLAILLRAHIVCLRFLRPLFNEELIGSRGFFTFKASELLGLSHLLSLWGANAFCQVMGKCLWEFTLVPSRALLFVASGV